MKTFQQNTMKLSLIILAIGFLVACGSSKTADSGFGTVDSSSTSTNTEKPAVAVCSQDVAGSSSMKVRLMQYVDPYGATRSDYVRLQFKVAPSDWASGDLDLLLYRWTASSDNATSLDSTPLSYQLEKKVGSGFQLLSNQAYQIMNWTEIQQFALATNVNAASPQDFFQTVTVLVNLKDMTNSYQALRVNLRQNGTVVHKMDVLIPTFQADPAKYNADTRHPVSLQALHPLKDKLGQSWTQANYFEFARSFCF